MFTRCPGCQTVHPLNASLLAQGNGLYRCGRCNKVSNALQNLFDARPGKGEAPSSASAGNRQPPVLSAGTDISKQSTEADVSDPGEEDQIEEFDLPVGSGFEDWSAPSPRVRRDWAIAAGVMIVVTALNLFFVSGDALLAHPAIRGALEGIGAVAPRPEPTYRDLDLLHLASSEMHSHPTLDETLVLNATIVNRGGRAQPFPALQITLFDAQNQPLASRTFAPEEYLPPGSDAQTGMPPGAYLPVIMELLDPGKHAVGFEMKFH